MILITHAVVGAVLSGAINNPAGSFLAGVVSHYVLDAIPHYDYVDQRFVDDRFSKRSKLIFKFIILDGIFGVLLPVYFFQWNGLYGFLNIFLAIAGAMLPDALQGVQLYFPNKLTLFLNKIHKQVHYLFSERLLLQEFPFFGLSLQVLVIMLAMLVIPAYVGIK